MSFVGGSSKANDQLVREQKAQADEAKAKEAQRQARLASGRAMIDAVFGGGTVTGPSETATRKVWRPGTMTRVMNRPAVRTSRDQNMSPTWTTKYAPGGYVDENYTIPGATTTHSGIGQDFYEGFRKSLGDFYNPEVERQFGDAKKANLFDMARRGTMRSSDAVDKNADLTRDYANANAKVQSDIEGQVTGLKTDVNNSRTRALQLLTSTEDPTVAANTARTEVNAIQSRAPQFSDLGNLFASAINSYTNYKNGQAGRAAVAGVPARSPYKSTGVVYG